MNKLKNIQTFVAIAEGGNLTAASHRLDVSLPTVVRTLAELERHLGVTLFNRTTRRVNLTDEGSRYLETCRAVLLQLHEAEQALGATRDRPSGRLTVTSSVSFGRMHVAPLLSAFVKRHPDVSAELILLDRVVDLVEDGIDVGVRIGSLPDSSLHGMNVGQVRRVVCASPGYLRRRAAPRHPRELSQHATVHFSGLGSSRHMQFVDRGKPFDVAIEPVWTSNSIDATLGAVADGLGVGQFLSYMVEPFVRNGALRLVLQPYAPACVPVTMVYPHSRWLSTRVRMFLDESAPRLRESLPDFENSTPEPRPVRR